MVDSSKDCDYCGQPGVEVDCTGSTCCIECWEEMKNWTPEKQAELDKLSKEVCDWLRVEAPKIKVENGLAPDAFGTVCLRCRKMVKCDEDGFLYCDCRNERNGIDPNNSDVLPLPERFLRGLN